MELLFGSAQGSWFRLRGIVPDAELRSLGFDFAPGLLGPVAVLAAWAYCRGSLIMTYTYTVYYMYIEFVYIYIYTHTWQL